MKNFPYDVWVYILCLLSPLDIVAFERTCRDARLIAQERHIWLAILNNMTIDYAPAFPRSRPPLSLSLSELRAIADRAQRAFSTWTHANVIRPTTETMIPVPHPEHRPAFVKSVEGTPYVVAYSCDAGLRCMDAESGVCVWMGTLGSHRLFYLHHAYTEVAIATQMQSSESLLICCCTSNEAYKSFCIEVIQVNVTAGTSLLVFSYPVGYDTPYWRLAAVRMSGEVVVAFGFSVLLVAHWQTGRTIEINVRYEILAVQVSDNSIYILWINENRQAYLSVVPTGSLWGAQTRVAVLLEMRATLLFPIHSEIPLEAGVRMSLFKRVSLNGQNNLESTITIASCVRLARPFQPQLHVSMWRIGIREVTNIGETPFVVSQELQKGCFSVNSGLQYSSIDISDVTASGRFVILTRDTQRHRRFYGSSYARIEEGDLRLIPLEIPCDREEMSVDRVSVDEYSGDILWICFCYNGIILTRFG